LLEAVPVAATAAVRVVAMEYALAPEEPFPAAVNDVMAVYRQLIANQSPASVGIYGCSAGGLLTAQATARMIADDIPTPGAIAMLCGTGLNMIGDSLAASSVLTGQLLSADAPTLGELPYFAGADLLDPMGFPGNHPDLLTHFPPSLLVTGSRDFAASSVTVMHRRILDAGVDASLLYFDGMPHAHHMATSLPEARETFAALASFFNSNLA
jgi:acetyl esterase/lipase